VIEQLSKVNQPNIPLSVQANCSLPLYIQHVTNGMEITIEEGVCAPPK